MSHHATAYLVERVGHRIEGVTIAASLADEQEAQR